MQSVAERAAADARARASRKRSAMEVIMDA
jgi:hypothetical protein